MITSFGNIRPGVSTKVLCMVAGQRRHQYVFDGIGEFSVLLGQPRRLTSVIILVTVPSTQWIQNECF